MPQRRLVIAASVIAGLLAACSQKQTTSVATRQNPFFSKSTLPFEAPPFDKIQNSDYQPAIDSGMSAQIAEVRAIADNPAPPTFENTFVALEKSGALLNRVSQVFNGVTGANTNDTLQKISELEAPKFAAHQDAIFLDSALFKRAETIYDARDTLKLDPESKRLVEWDYERFVHAGARLSNADKAKLQELNKEESSLSAAFTNKLLAAAKAGALVIDDSSKLAGFNASEMQASADAAKARGLTGKWLIPLQNTTQQPSLLELNDRATREQLFNASWTRAEKADSNDTRQTIARLAQVRAQKAQLLGFPDYSAWVLENQMAKKPATVLKFVRDLVPAATARARSEGNAIQAMITKDGDSFQLEPWDWDHYSDQVRKAQFDLDENQIKPYFELNNVLQNGVFYAANQLYGLTFKERKDIPVYQPDVRVFEVFDAERQPRSRSSTAIISSATTRTAAPGWIISYSNPGCLVTKPVVYNVANFTKPAPGQPALLTFDDVIDDVSRVRPCAARDVR